MSDNVTRYGMRWNADRDINYLGPQPSGDWVKYVDHARVEAERDRLRAEVERLRAENARLDLACLEWQAENMKLQAKIAHVGGL